MRYAQASTFEALFVHPALSANFVSSRLALHSFTASQLTLHVDEGEYKDIYGCVKEKETYARGQFAIRGNIILVRRPETIIIC